MPPPEVEEAEDSHLAVEVERIDLAGRDFHVALDEHRLLEIELAQHFRDGRHREDPVGVKIHAVIALDRHGDVQIASRCQNPLKLGRRPLGPLGIDRITVSPEADVLQHT